MLVWDIPGGNFILKKQWSVYLLNDSVYPAILSSLGIRQGLIDSGRWHEQMNFFSFWKYVPEILPELLRRLEG